VPEGFTASEEEDVDWIIAMLEEIGSPVDLVGHDWGSALTVRVASLRPGLVRTRARMESPLEDLADARLR
jgi:pimeloyl-ACP methyl ester carboxylesterase